MTTIKLDKLIKNNTDGDETNSVTPIEQNMKNRLGKKDKKGRVYATGKRKDAIARVWVKEGKGEVTINNKKMLDYIDRPVLIKKLIAPLTTCGVEKKLDVFITVKGGGISGQCGAIAHGISKGLVALNPGAFYPILRQDGFMTRDPRVVERKKYGRKKARKKFQFSKR